MRAGKKTPYILHSVMRGIHQWSAPTLPTSPPSPPLPSAQLRAAASRLGVTPSALSHSMRQLEERLGVRLFHRTTRSVSVTDAGLRLLERMRPAID